MIFENTILGCILLWAVPDPVFVVLTLMVVLRLRLVVVVVLTPIPVPDAVTLLLPAAIPCTVLQEVAFPAQAWPWGCV